jgi:NosR/NirI family nitrous oxide reductase transcriptional regulator
MKKLRILTALVAVLSLGAGQLLQQEVRVDERSLFAELAPGAVFFEKTGSPPHYRSDRGVAAFITHDVRPEIRGYAGPIKVLVVLGSDGRIKGLKILSHRETKNYVHYMETPAYIGRFIGKSVYDRFEIDKDVDGISKATVSVEALARSVRESSRAVAANVYGIQTSPEGSLGAGSWSWVWYALFVLFGVAGYFLTRRDRRYRILRDISLVGSFVVVGLYLASPFSVLHIFNLALGRPSSSPLWYVIVGSTLVSVLVAGRFYCGWLCPFGALCELIGRIPIRKWSIPATQDERWRNLKYGLLMLATALVFLSGKVDNGNYEAYITLFAFHGTWLAWALVILSLAANLRIERFWCRYLCPVAALTGLLSRKARGYVSRDGCPMGNKPDPEIAECIRCNRCYNANAASVAGPL